MYKVNEKRKVNLKRIMSIEELHQALLCIYIYIYCISMYIQNLDSLRVPDHIYAVMRVWGPIQRLNKLVCNYDNPTLTLEGNAGEGGGRGWLMHVS